MAERTGERQPLTTEELIMNAKLLSEAASMEMEEVLAQIDNADQGRDSEAVRATDYARGYLMGIRHACAFIEWNKHNVDVLKLEAMIERGKERFRKAKVTVDSYPEFNRALGGEIDE